MQSADERKSRIVFPVLVTLAACTPNSEPPKESPKTEASSAASANVAPSASASAEAAPAAPSASAVTPPPEPPRIDIEAVNTVLVWKEDKKARGGFRTSWVELKDGKPNVVDERPGVIFVSSSSLWTLEIQSVKGCLQYAHNPDNSIFTIQGVPQQHRPMMEMPVLTRISDKATIAPWKDGHGYPYVGTQCEPFVEEYSASVTIKGGMGPFVIARLGHYIFDGGAHGLRGERYFTLDLEKLAPVDLEPQPVDRPALIAKAAKELSVEPKDVGRNGLEVAYGPNGTALVSFRFLASATHAESGGNSYAADYVIDTKNLPPEMVPYGRLPKWTIALMKPKPVPVFMIPPEQTRLFRSQFEAAYPPAPASEKKPDKK